MTTLATLPILNFAPAIAALPRRPGAQVQPMRGIETYITLHYSGVVYADRSRAREERRILDEARYQLNKNWARPRQAPVYGSRYQYDYVVLSDGAIVRCQPDRAVLWHCGNATGNNESWAVHVMTGPSQPLTAPQRAALYALFDALRADGDIPRDRVVGHCEWPRIHGVPRPSDVYWQQPGQGPCPGVTVFADLLSYRKAQ